MSAAAIAETCGELRNAVYAGDLPKAYQLLTQHGLEVAQEVMLRTGFKIYGGSKTPVRTKWLDFQQQLSKACRARTIS